MVFWFALWGNLQRVFITAALTSALACVAGAIFLAGGYAEDDSNTKHTGNKILGIVIPIAIFTSMIASLPTAQDLWEARIALVKYELASPENVGAAKDQIERIAKGLECKY